MESDFFQFECFSVEVNFYIGANKIYCQQFTGDGNKCVKRLLAETIRTV
jgi:hypothetical protein